MDKPKVHCRLLLPCFLFLSACTVDISQPDSSATAVDAGAKTWAVKFQHQSSFTEQSIKEITEPDLKPGDLLFSSSHGVTSFGIRVFSTSSVSHVAIYLGENNVAEATGAGVQIVSLKKAMKHSDKLFVLRVPDLTPQQATESWFCSEFVTDAFAKAGHPLTLAQSGWISPADLMHMRTGDVSAFKPETQLQYVGHLKPGIYIKAGRFVGLTQ